MPVIRKAFRPVDVQYVAERYSPVPPVQRQGVAAASVRQAGAVQRTGTHPFRLKLLLPQDTAEADYLRELAGGKRRNEPYASRYATADENLTGYG